MIGQDKKTTCCFCCERGPVSLRAQLERSAYVCGESIKLRADVDNQGEEEVRLKVKLLQVSVSHESPESTFPAPTYIHNNQTLPAPLSQKKVFFFTEYRVNIK